MSLTPTALERFAAGLAASPERWRHLVRHASDARVYEQIWDDEDVNAWVICWSEDQDTGFHDHDESSAAIAVISGQVQEDRLRLGDEPRSRVLGPNSIFTVPAVAIHRVLHAGGPPAVTIHAYSPRLVRTGAYRIGPDGELERELLTSEDELRGEPALS
jgi:mannose-6-phosphate isomerase-like protein (cupin superfamily)